MPFWDFYKIFTYAFEDDPQTKRDKARDLTGAGVSAPDVLPYIRQDGSFQSAGKGALRVGNDFVDLSSITNRQSRYKEYERLRNVPEIEQVMTVIADEACLAGDTPVNTLFEGEKTLQWLAENKADEEFFVYSWDFEKEDLTLAVAYEPRLVKKAKTLKVILDDGSRFIATPDHLVLLKNQAWAMTGELKKGDELMPFYKVKPNKWLNKFKNNQFPRIWTSEGWKHERQFIEEWKANRSLEKYEKINEAIRMVSGGLGSRKTAELMGHDRQTIRSWLAKEGFTFDEIRWLAAKPNYRTVVSVIEGDEIDVYDLSVKDTKNFCGGSVIFHNCQKDKTGNVLEIRCKNEEVKKECEFLLLHRKMLNLNRKLWQITKRLCINGDGFYEVIISLDNPKGGILGIKELPPESMYRIETTKGKLIEFQQGNEGPDYEALTKSSVVDATEAELEQSKAIRFANNQIVHMRLGEDRKTFYPYGQSLIEPARGPAHQLRLMEDSMVIYRLCLAGNTRIRTLNSYKYIKDLTIEDVVASYDFNTNQTVLSPVTFAENTGKQKVYDVISRHVKIRGNETHPILVKRDDKFQYVDIKNLQPKKDRLVNVVNDAAYKTKIPRIFGKPWAKLSKEQRNIFRSRQYKNKTSLLRKCENIGRARQFLYTKGKALPLEKAQKICDIFGLNKDELLIVNKGEINSERICLPDYVNEEFARLFGFLIGDGHIRRYEINFSTSPNEDVNKYYYNLLKKYFGRAAFKSDKRSKRGLGKIAVTSVIASKIFRALGYNGNHNEIRIPEWVFTSPKNIRKAFVEGISDADGCERYTQKGTWFSTIELSNLKLIEDIKELWSSIGLCSGHIKSRNRINEHTIEGRKIPNTTSHSVTISECLLPETENITKVIEAGVEEVFDIGVSSNLHNFVANGICVHNSRAPERRVFYIDVGQMAHFRAESFMQRMQDLLRKRKVVNKPGEGSSAMDERWTAPSADEDFWIPVRPNSKTRIDTLPGAQNLGEIDDAVYFRNKLYTALNFPANYLTNEDVSSTRITLSYQNAKFARMIERIQEHVEDGIWEIADRHLRLRGFPEEAYEDLVIKITTPSEYRDLSRAEIDNNRINNANALKGSLLYSDFDILTMILKHSEEEAEMMIARMKMQKLEEAKLQILVQNPQLLGVGAPATGEEQMGAEAGGPSPMLGPEGEPDTGKPEDQVPQEQPEQGMSQPQGKGEALPEPSPEELKRYDLEIQSYSQEVDREEIDYSTV
ncbi:MAG: hypothetical protein DWQ19_12345 [Crenarchaeota archaeon]|nr:MAG: hypothetical protein DWQ19_12345 [Thermoproteota archaeon]